MSSSIHWSPYCDLPPTHFYSLYIEHAPLVLGGDASEHDAEYHPVVDSGFSLQGIEFAGCRTWKDLDGLRTWAPSEHYGDASIYISGRHNLVDILELSIKRLQGTSFQVSGLLAVDFEFEGVDYQNDRFAFTTELSFSRMTISIPNWSKPDEVVIPKAWKVPEEWTAEIATEFAGRFVDLTDYSEPEIDRHSIAFRPRE